MESQAAQMENGYGGNGPGQPGWINPDPGGAAALRLQISNIIEGRRVQNQLQNLFQQGVPGAGQLPGMAKGGNVVAQPHRIGAGKAPGFAGKKAMTTNEPIVGMGTMTGTPKFIVGEPVTPGGPPRAERLKITPLHKDAIPLGKMRQKVAA